jgi:hypothetical protein
VFPVVVVVVVVAAAVYFVTTQSGNFWIHSRTLHAIILTSRYRFTLDKFIVTFLLSLAPQPNLGLGLLHKIQLNFLEASQQFYFLKGRVVSPTPNPNPGRPGLCIYIPQSQGGYPF